MKGTESFELMARYNQWMNGKLYVVCAEVPDAERKTDRGAFFSSIHGTLNHLMFGDYAWMNRLANRTYDIKPIGEDYFEEFEQMRSAREALDEDILTWSSTIDPAWLAEEITWVSKAYDREFTHSNWQLVTHMFNHQTHHRGQLTTLLAQAGKDYGPTDIPFM
ncbi:MAG: DinB family protein [Pseudomonadota bacterium]